MTLRSGTNQLRGSGIVLHRGTWLDSNQIQNIRNNISNKEHKYYNGEAMVSGPIRRNKTFFMGGYQGFYENIPFPVTRTIPTEAQLRGDFSQTTTANGTPILIYDPATTSCTADFSSCTRQPFSGNVIPEERWNPIARALLPYIPRPNATPSNLVGLEQLHQLAEHRPLPLQLVPDPHRPCLQRQPSAVVDQHRQLGHRVPERERAAGAGDPQRQLPDAPQPLPASPSTTTTRSTRATLWNTRVSWDRFDEPHDKDFGNIDPEAAVHGRVPGDRAAVPADQHRRLRGHVPADVPPAEERRLLREQQRYRRRWAVTSRRWAENSAPTSSTARTRSTRTARSASSNDFTRRDPLSTTGAASGNGFATFLLGLPTSGNVTTGHAADRAVPLLRACICRTTGSSAPRATLNVGLRWDYQPAVTVKDNLTVSGFDVNVDQPAAVAAAAGRRRRSIRRPGSRSCSKAGCCSRTAAGRSRRTRPTGTTSSRASALTLHASPTG